MWDNRYKCTACLHNLDLVGVLNELTVSQSHTRMCTGSWFLPLGPATANARVRKCVTEEQTTRSPRVADRSLFLLPTVVTGRQRSAMYDGASPCSALYISRHILNWTRCGTGSQWRRSRSTCLMWSCFLALLSSSQTAAGQVDSVELRPADCYSS